MYLVEMLEVNPNLIQENMSNTLHVSIDELH